MTPLRTFLPVLVVFLIALTSCSEEVPEPNATVLGKGLDCGWLIQFHSEQSGLPASADHTYIMVNEDTEYHLENTDVYVEVRDLNGTDEGLICTAMGIAYPQIFIEKMEH